MSPIKFHFHVMPGLVPGIHAFNTDALRVSVDGRVKPGHDEDEAWL
jgi:hypothetical protein